MLFLVFQVAAMPVVSRQSQGSESSYTIIPGTIPPTNQSESYHDITCDIQPIDGSTWRVGRVEGETLVTFDFEVAENGCYLLELLYPRVCHGASFSIGVPVELTYHGVEKMHAYIDQTSDGGKWDSLGHVRFYKGHNGKLVLGGYSPEYVDSEDASIQWVVPNLRVTWWNDACSMPREGIPQAETDELLFLAPEVHDFSRAHTVTFKEAGCYLIEAEYVIGGTETLMIHNDFRAHRTSSDSPGSWEVLTLRSFTVDEQFEVHTAAVSSMINAESMLKVTYVGRSCYEMRRVTIEMEGRFSQLEYERLSRRVLVNVQQETTGESDELIRAIKLDVRKKDDRILIDLYMFGVTDYEARTICNLIHDHCTARVIVNSPVDFSLVFHDTRWLRTLGIMFYVVMLFALIVLCAGIWFLLLRWRGASDARNLNLSPSANFALARNMQPIELRQQPNNSNFQPMQDVPEDDPSKFVNASNGGVQFVIGRPSPTKVVV